MPASSFLLNSTPASCLLFLPTFVGVTVEVLWSWRWSAWFSWCTLHGVLPGVLLHLTPYSLHAVGVLCLLLVLFITYTLPGMDDLLPSLPLPFWIHSCNWPSVLLVLRCGMSGILSSSVPVQLFFFFSFFTCLLQVSLWSVRVWHCLNSVGLLHGCDYTFFCHYSWSGMQKRVFFFCGSVVCRCMLLPTFFEFYRSAYNIIPIL